MLDTLLNGRYKLIRILGSGGFGQTFVAEDLQHGDCPLQCVVKQFKPLSRDQVFLEVARRLFFNEVEMLRKLGSHDRIPALLDNFEEDGQFYLVQEQIEGRSLSEELQIYHTLNEPQVIELLRDVCEILEFVHREHVIHRDIKPSNLIRRRQDGRFVLIDFGAVKELNTQISTNLEPTQLTVGIATQGYGPTEQLAGKPRFNSDLYALGMTAIQALTGLHPSQLPTDATTGEVIWRDRVTISPWLAAIVTQLVRYHFNDRFQSAIAVLEALDQTALVQPIHAPSSPPWNDETLIPQPITREATVETALLPTTEAPSLKHRGRKKRFVPLVISVVGLITTGFIAGMRQLGWLQPLELAAFDRMVQLSPPRSVDPRLLVVGITEADIQAQNRFPLSDEIIAQTIQRLQAGQPRAIGLDLYRDLPQEPGRAALLAALKAPNTIAIFNLGSPITPAPPGVPPERVGFNDVVLDADGVLRRNLLFAEVPEYPDARSFALQLAILYLEPQNIRLRPSPGDPNLAQLGQVTLIPLNPQSGGYQNLDDRGYQIMMQYRGYHAIEQVSLGDVLQGKLRADQVRDRIVLIGTTAANAKDLFFTPYSPAQTVTPKMPGVVIHAHMVGQLLSLALGEKKPIWYWSPSLEVVWILGWALLAASIAWRCKSRVFLLLLTEGMLLISLLGISYGLFLQQGWVPVAAPAIALFLASTGVVLDSQAKEESKEQSGEGR
ncbi:MAG: CHASE2 domain-containing protein [Leptolyngbyaceae cyanobacterium bins.349]|nr:CHASE2 domain-containing protein [Leptolyngbyaceae cyanobacterium bins.349]